MGESTTAAMWTSEITSTLMKYKQYYYCMINKMYKSLCSLIDHCRLFETHQIDIETSIGGN